MEKNDKQRPDNSDDANLQPDLRFASRESSEPTQKGAGATPKKPRSVIKFLGVNVAGLFFPRPGTVFMSRIKHASLH